MSRRMDVYLESLVATERFMFYQTVCDFAQQEIAPHLLGWERQRCLLPEKALQAMADLGLFGLTVAEEYGGQGGLQTELVLMGLALGYHSHSVAITPGAAASLGIKPLQLFGREDQKRTHLPDLAAGRRMFVFGLSEPGRGSDAANPASHRHARIPGGWRLNGEKCWSTNAKWASHVVVHAMTRPQNPARTPLHLLHRADGRPQPLVPRNGRQRGMAAILHRRHRPGRRRGAGIGHAGRGGRGLPGDGDDAERRPLVHCIAGPGLAGISRWTPAAPTPRSAGSSAISPSGASSACRTCCSTWTLPWSRASPG